MKPKYLLVICLLVGFFGCGRWGLAFRPATNAMAPTLTIEDACNVNPFEYSSHPVERFDIVVYQSPDEIKQRMVQLVMFFT
jgi:hypothetical protein